MLLNESKTLTALYDILGHRQGKTDQIIGSFSRHVEQGLGIEKKLGGHVGPFSFLVH